MFFLFICLVGVCGDFPAETSHHSETSQESLQENISLPNSANDFLRPTSSSRKLLSLKDTIKMTGDRTQKSLFTKKRGSKIATSSTKKIANFASREISIEVTVTQTTMESTTEEKSTESSTEQTTTESLTEQTTTESTTEQTTTESTTEQTITETSTLEMTSKPITYKTITKFSTNIPNATKSWQKYFSKSTPATTGSTDSQIETSRSMPSFRILKYDVTEPTSGYTKSKPTTLEVSPAKERKDSKLDTKTESKFPTTAPSRNDTSANISIHIDIEMLSSLNATSEASSPETPANRDEKKRVVAGVLVVVLVSVSAACAVLLVLMPSSYDLRCRRHQQIPDQVALIPSKNKCRPRFYDSSLSTGH